MTLTGFYLVHAQMSQKTQDMREGCRKPALSSIVHHADYIYSGSAFSRAQIQDVPAGAGQFLFETVGMPDKVGV